MSMPRAYEALVLFMALGVFGCASQAPAPPAESAAATPDTVHPEIWPLLQSPVPRNPDVEKAVEALLQKMTLEEKVGQVLQPSITSITPAEVRTYHIGSVLNGGGGCQAVRLLLEEIAHPGTNHHIVLPPHLIVR